MAPQNFSADISAMCVDGVFSGPPCQELNKVVCEHLFRQGKMEVGEALMEVCQLEKLTGVCFLGPNCTGGGADP